MTSGTPGCLNGLIGIVIFGLTLPLARLAVTELDPVFVGAGRAAVAAAVAISLLLLLGQGSFCRPS